MGCILLLGGPLSEISAADSAAEDVGDESDSSVEAVAVASLANTFYFDFSQEEITLTDEERNLITQIMVLVRQDTTAKVLLTGHTDNMDEEEFNYQLGLSRATSVKDYFLNFGLPQDRVEVASKGEVEPIADNATQEGRAKNRRVELEVTVVR